MRWGLRILAAAACAAALSATGAAPVRAQAIDVDALASCNEPVPAAAAVPGLGGEVALHLHMVLDQGVTLDEGRAAVARAQESYTPLGIRLVPNFTTATLPSADMEEIFKWLRKVFGGGRPPWAHVVYALSKRDLDAHAFPNPYGSVDCVGGVVTPEAAFAAGEIVPEDENSTLMGAIPYPKKGTGIVVAHEIGHLLGAHHHYANCVEPVDGEPAKSPCTLMWADAGLITPRFGAFEASVVRGHALTYLPPITVAPPPDGSLTVAPVMPPCEAHPYVDPAGDQATQPDDTDLLAGSFYVDAAAPDVARFRWKVTSLDGTFKPGVTQVFYWLMIDAPKRYRIEVTWDGKSAPAARVYEGTTAVADLPVRLVTGPDGIVEVDLPLKGLGLAGSTLRLGQIEAFTDLDHYIDYDDARPDPQVIGPLGCSPIPASQAGDARGPLGPATNPLAAPRLRLTPLDRSARRATRTRRLRVRVTGVVASAAVRLLDARARTVGRARTSALNGSRVMTLRLRRPVRRGAYRFAYSGRNGAGVTITGRVSLKLGR